MKARGLASSASASESRIKSAVVVSQRAESTAAAAAITGQIPTLPARLANKQQIEIDPHMVAANKCCSTEMESASKSESKSRCAAAVSAGATAAAEKLILISGELKHHHHHHDRLGDTEASSSKKSAALLNTSLI